MSGSGRKRTTDRHYSAEDQALDQISKEAEERIQARRQARAEAREMRMKEIERQQKEEEDKQKAQSQGTDSVKALSSFSGSRRGSNDSTESDMSSKDSNDPKDQLRKSKIQLRELEDKYKAAMLTNAQLDNIKTSNIFQIELLKEQLEEQEEQMLEVQREYKDKSRDYDFLKRDFDALKLDNEGIRHQMDVKDRLLKESGLVIVQSQEGEFSLTKCSDMSEVPVSELGTAIISEEAADLLKRAGEGTLDDKLKKIIAEQKSLQEEINALNTRLGEERSKKDSSATKVNAMNGPEMQLYEVQREASKQIHEYKLKLQKAEQEITNLDGSKEMFEQKVNRLETQVKRFKYDAEEAEKLEEELKADRRRLQRELRECQNQIEELQNQNKHLNKRLEKIRQSRSALGVAS